MKLKFLIMYFILYLYITSSSFFLLQSSLYNLHTNKNLTSRKVCLIIIDGLRYDLVPSMEFLNSISTSSEGILFKGYSSMPSFSRPGYERILTGTQSKINGILSNKIFTPSLTPNLLSISKFCGLNNLVCGFFWLYQLYPLSIDKGAYYFLRDGSTFTWAKEHLEGRDYSLCIIHPMTMDKKGHKFGGSSEEYKLAAIEIDKQLQDMFNFLSEKGYTMIVTSDHGQRNEGGHGDDSAESTTVPIAIIDKNLGAMNPADNTGTKRLLDIAPTVCDLLGIPKSIFMTGDSLIQHNNEIYNIRKDFSGKTRMNFEKYFKLTSILTNIILSVYTVIFTASFFIILRLLKLKLE